MTTATLTRTSAQRRDLGALTGVLYVLFFVAGLVIAGALGPSGTVTPYSSDAEVQTYRLKDPATLENLFRILGLLQGLSALALLAFVPCLTAFVRRYGSDAGRAWSARWPPSPELSSCSPSAPPGFWLR